MLGLGANGDNRLMLTVARAGDIDDDESARLFFFLSLRPCFFPEGAEVRTPCAVGAW